MMYADLIDAEDFRDRLVALGIDLPADADPDESARLAAQQHACRAVPGLSALVAELETQLGVMQPEVREALERHLRPALG
ncbi:hypothetical protein [Billgrantia bachuensis]|uniref:Uncharacterized protein n=1 Tax=Billgrantia bachuensis TaxID=2717286 RepID=A0ABX0PSS3_9GAMM|nr:hypothetical protein [Halomonas bachuensis]NIC05293.1 hypothetical protein [Halomonas bachuensis]